LCQDQLLIEAQEVQQELQTRILSLEYQNSKLSKKLRSEEAQAEKQETLYKLQIQERDLLLRVLTDQVKDLRLVISKQEMISKISAPPQIPVRDNSVQRYRTGEYQTSKNQVC
jgi:aminopeptidase N